MRLQWMLLGCQEDTQSSHSLLAFPVHRHEELPGSMSGKDQQALGNGNEVTDPSASTARSARPCRMDFLNGKGNQMLISQRCG